MSQEVTAAGRLCADLLEKKIILKDKSNGKLRQQIHFKVSQVLILSVFTSFDFFFKFFFLSGSLAFSKNLF